MKKCANQMTTLEILLSNSYCDFLIGRYQRCRYTELEIAVSKFELVKQKSSIQHLF